jgi:hypothetical protein
LSFGSNGSHRQKPTPLNSERYSTLSVRTREVKPLCVIPLLVAGSNTKCFQLSVRNRFDVDGLIFYTQEFSSSRNDISLQLNREIAIAWISSQYSNVVIRRSNLPFALKVLNRVTNGRSHTRAKNEVYWIRL